MTSLEQLGAFVAQSSAPSQRLREVLELHVADIVGAWIASLPTPEGAALLRWRAASGEGAAPGSIHRLRLDVATHCALARLSEVDDIHLASTTTPGAIVVPGAVAVAAALRNRDPDALAAAMIAGYEVMVRFGQAIDGPSVLYRGIWPTYFATPLGIAAVAARLLDLCDRQLRAVVQRRHETVDARHTVLHVVPEHHGFLRLRRADEAVQVDDRLQRVMLPRPSSITFPPT